MWFLLDVGHHLLERRARGERRLPGEKMVQGAAETVDVGANVGLVGVVGLLRGDVIDRAQDDARARQVRSVRGFAGEACQAEIENFHPAVGCPHQVVWLEVSVDHALLEGVLKSERRLADVLAGMVHRQRAALMNQLAQVYPLYVLHHQEMRLTCVFGVEGMDDIRVGQASSSAHLAAETLQGGCAGRVGAFNDLERHRPMQDPMLGLVHRSHAAHSEKAHGAVALVAGQFRRQGVGDRRAVRFSRRGQRHGRRKRISHGTGRSGERSLHLRRRIDERIGSATCAAHGRGVATRQGCRREQQRRAPGKTCRSQHGPRLQFVSPHRGCLERMPPTPRRWDEHPRPPLVFSVRRTDEVLPNKEVHGGRYPVTNTENSLEKSVEGLRAESYGCIVRYSARQPAGTKPC